MIPTDKFLIETPRAIQDGDERVCVGYVVTPVGSGNWAVVYLLQAVIKQAFTRDGIAFHHPGGLAFDACVFVTFWVSDRGAALRSLHETLESLGLMPQCGLAYHRPDSDRWHTLAGIPFRHEQLLTPANFELADQELRRVALAGAVMGEIEKGPSEAKNGGPQDGEFNPS